VPFTGQPITDYVPGYTPEVPGGDPYLSPFGPGNDLRFQYLNPAASQRLEGMATQSDQSRIPLAQFTGFSPFQAIAPTDPSGAQGYYGEAATAFRGQPLSAFQSIGTPGSFAPGSDVSALRGQQVEALNRLNTGPTRTELAQQALQSLDESTADERSRGIRQIGQSAAALGRLGSGMVTTDLGNLEERLQGQRERTLRDLAVQTGSQEFSDQLARLGATGDVGSQLYGQDVTQAGFDQSLRGEARGERGAQLGYEQAGAQLGLQRGSALQGLGGADLAMRNLLREQAVGERGAQLGFEQANLGAQQGVAGQLAGLESDQAAREAALRGEIRGERDYQVGTAQQAQEDAIRRRLLEEQLLNDAFNRQLSRANLSMGIAGQVGQEAGASNQAVSDLLSQLALLDQLRRRGQPGTAQTPTDATGTGLS
jgi:hypothetical protein